MSAKEPNPANNEENKSDDDKVQLETKETIQLGEKKDDEASRMSQSIALGAISLDGENNNEEAVSTSLAFAEEKSADKDFYLDLLKEKPSTESIPTVTLLADVEEEDVASSSTKSGHRRTTAKNVTIDSQFLPPPKEFPPKESFTLTEDDVNIFETWEEMAPAEESSQSVVEEERIDRNMYYEMYTLFNQQYRKEKLKNNFLQTRLAGYYTKRKMTNVLREPYFHLEELQRKYEKELEALEGLIEVSDLEKQMSQGEYFHLKTKREQKTVELDNLFVKLQHAEAEYGKTLTYEKTGRHNMDKVVERFLKRQRSQTLLTMKLRSEYINLRNRMNDKLRALEALDHLGPGFTIMDYVQLKTDNRDLHDKLEEKDSELLSLRKICQNTMQILAHNREKSSVIDLDIGNLKEEVESITIEYEEARHNLHYLIHERDEFRNEVKNLKTEYSLFINRKLLRDMEHSVDDMEDLRSKLTSVKSKFYVAEHNLKMVRKNLKYFLHAKQKEKDALTRSDEV